MDVLSRCRFILLDH